jgi:hypothetical protein
MGIGASAMVIAIAGSSVHADFGKEIYYKGLHGQRACVECHLQSGSGMIEGASIVLPINKQALFSSYSGLPTVGRETLTNGNMYEKSVHKYVIDKYGKIPARPAYNDKTLETAITKGIDPSNRHLEVIMPKYTYSGTELKSLVSFLKTLNTEKPVGVTTDRMKLVTIVSDGIPESDVKIFENKIKQFVFLHNRSASKVIKDFRAIDYSIWKLTGDQSTWPKQLEEKYKQTPPTLIVSGMVTGSWDTIQQFSEDKHIPTLLPITDAPGLTPSIYTYYWTKGLSGEGDSADEYIKSHPEYIKAFGNYEEIKSQLSSGKKLVVSATMLGKDLLNLTTEQRKKVKIVYPYYIPQEANATFRFRTPRYGEVPGVQSSVIVDSRIEYKANTIEHLLGDIMTRLRGDFTSNHIADVIGTIMIGGDMGVSDDSPYTHISFNPRQRFVGSIPQIVNLTEDDKISIVE